MNGRRVTISSAPNTPEAMRKRTLPGKRDKMEFNERMLRMGRMNETQRPVSYHGKSEEPSPSPLRKRHVQNRPKDTLNHRRSMPSATIFENKMKDKFDISSLDTNLPRIDLDAIENHLLLAREQESKGRCDRDEIRRRLALESDDNVEKGGRKPSLHSRLQSSMNLQICFMNETASDSDSPGSEAEHKQQQPSSLPHIQHKGRVGELFYSRQVRLQADARQALSQAKDLAKLQMSHEKEKRRFSPITQMVRNSLEKVGVRLSSDRRRLSRQLLTEMNLAQLQVIVNDLHTHIEDLNGKLVGMLLDRDDLHMEQDSLLLDIDDLTRYLCAKESQGQSLPFIPPPNNLN